MQVAAVVDPVEPEKLQQLADELGVKIECVLTTHNHWDHSGGNKKIVKMLPHLKGKLRAASLSA